MKLVLEPRIELESIAYEAIALPLSYTSMVCPEGFEPPRIRLEGGGSSAELRAEIGHARFTYPV